MRPSLSPSGVPLAVTSSSTSTDLSLHSLYNIEPPHTSPDTAFVSPPPPERNTGSSVPYGVVVLPETHENLGPRIYSCAFCSYSSAVRSQLHRHLRIHTNARPFSCLYCPYRSNFKNDVVKHMKRKHPALEEV